MQIKQARAGAIAAIILVGIVFLAAYALDGRQGWEQRATSCLMYGFVASLISLLLTYLIFNRVVDWFFVCIYVGAITFASIWLSDVRLHPLAIYLSLQVALSILAGVWCKIVFKNHQEQTSAKTDQP